ncbi:VLRF1 family aeRF1-type release factor [Streptomonospora algeriensis]|uniref:VLRF1 family aeRF1-type release factor n=1 Tax=Streptomonospora algeriensis TaxID=995084 RepID=A0ABW3BJG3_9ACTN
MNVIIDPTSVRDLAAMNDEMGVLSVYATADPRDKSASPAWRLAVGNELGALRNGVAGGGDKERRAAVLDRLDRLQPEIETMLDSGESGVGRALFAPVSSDEVHTLTVQMPLDDCAVLERRPYLRPLAGALTFGAPAGVLAVSHEGVRVIDLRFGIAREATRLAFELDTDDWRSMRGDASGGQAGSPSRSATQLDRFDRRVEDNLQRYLASLRPRISRMADDHGWESLVITGDRRLLDVVRKGLSASPARRDVVLLDRVAESLSTNEIAALVRPELERSRSRRYRALAEQARDAARSGGPGTTGLSDTLGAFRENRVAHLVLDGARELRGRRTPDGRHYPHGELPPGESAVAEENDLGERMIELAFTSGAQVTMLPPEAADVLAEEDGVAALLRW